MISVSIIIPTYNHAALLERALNSVQQQTFNSWEAIIIDNNSTDNTNEVISLFDNDERISSIKINNNGVIAKSRNTGILNAKGDWIAFLDSDDIWYPNRLEVIMKVAKKISVDIICNDEMRVDLISGAKKTLIHGRRSNNFYIDLIRRGNCLSPSASVVNRKFLSQSGILFSEREDFVTVEDYDFWINLARSGAKFKFLHKILGEYSIHGNNESLKNSQHVSHLNNVLAYHIELYEKSNGNAATLKNEMQSTKLLSDLLSNFEEIKFLKIIELIHNSFRISFRHSFLFLVEKVIVLIKSKFANLKSGC